MEINHKYVSNDRVDIANDFLIPVLKKSTRYRRAVGYFSISSLELLANGLEHILENNGRVQFIISPELSDSDIEKIKKGYELKYEEALNKISDKIHEDFEIENPYSLDLITNMIVAGILEIKIAFMKNGIFHEKIGELSNDKGEKICFSGSMNETFSGYKWNSEYITVFNNWTPFIKDYAEDISKRIDDLWEDQAPGITVIDFPDAIKHELIKKYRISADLETALRKYKESKRSSDWLSLLENESGKLRLYDYQKDAIKEFKKYNYQHFYEMATGTGKTFTAIRSIELVEKEKGPIYVTVVVPSIDLQIQWYEEFQKAGYKNVKMLGGYQSNSNWKYEFERSLIEFYKAKSTNKQSVVYIAVSDSYFDKMVSEISIIDEYMIVVDEAHELSYNMIKKLPNTAKYRLGLSATPERHDENEIKAIMNYFLTNSQESYKYTIEEAISSGALTKYNYYPIPVELTEDEYNKYKKYSIDIMIEMTKENRDEEKLKRLTNERSLIVKKAENKIEVLKELLKQDSSIFKNSVVYCGAGKSHNSEEMTVLQEVTKTLNSYGKLRVSDYTSKTENRKLVLEYFENNFFDTLVAIKCFDQGVDVPKLERIHLLASDSSMKQTIQRRGRVLRKCKETGKKIAYIYDYVALPPSHLPYESTMSTLLKNELFRVEEYLRLANNIDEIIPTIESWKKKFPIIEDEEVYLYD